MVGAQIKILKTGEIQTISETEFVGGVQIFYTDSGESFTDEQFVQNQTSVSPILENRQLTEFVLCSEKNKIAFNNLLTETAKFLPKKKIPKETSNNRTRTIKLFGWTITFSKSK